ncbi:transposase IS4 family protein [Paenibacillus mucilaginosus 3016]|uniref:Transposase IS4 family protein n=1 Tax=Paenibacillus mucilaginosus 3016 TaxID=1116391 RepID=H6N9K4_9BACL|nr:transposase IS4 family protein [Paenibacillus mucilaginosus 3016]
MLYTYQPEPQLDYELICIEHMVPDNHLLRHIQKHIDFSFITELVRPYYSQTHGRPSILPVMLFKMLLIGYLYGIRSERRSEQEINLNIAYRWFLGIGLSKKAPDHSEPE